MFQGLGEKLLNNFFVFFKVFYFVVLLLSLKYEFLEYEIFLNLIVSIEMFFKVKCKLFLSYGCYLDRN